MFVFDSRKTPSFQELIRFVHVLLHMDELKDEQPRPRGVIAQLPSTRLSARESFSLYTLFNNNNDNIVVSSAFLGIR